MRGDAVRDLQRRLTLSGHLAAGVATPGFYCQATELAVHEFQRGRGLRRTGRCDETTWSALVEASWALGDRVLFHTSPNLRGDDVAELQTLLARLGFDAGRVDGIFGPDTAAAVIEFQRNCGLAIDGACGRDTVRALYQLSRHTGAGPGVSVVRELESLKETRSTLHGHRLALGHFGGIAPVVRAVARLVTRAGAGVISMEDPEPSTQAMAANRYGAELFVGLEAHAGPNTDLAFYSVPGFTSPGGRRLATLLREHMTPVLTTEPHVTGMRLPILRETRMPAVMISLGPVRHVVDHAADLAKALVDALDRWVCTSGEEEQPPST